MLTVHKLVLDRAAEQQEVTLPLNCTVIKLEVQYNKPVLYYHCNDKEERGTKREIFRSLTGGTAPTLASYDYLGTVMLDEDSFVLHFFISK